MATMVKNQTDNAADQTADTSKQDPALKNKNYCIDFHGAAIIDEKGNEIAITEDMILGACESLDDNWPITPYHHSTQN